MNRKLIVAFGCLFWLGLGKIFAQAPSPDFSATPTAGCGPLRVQFTDQSANGPLFWNWDFGNGQTSNQQNPVVVYSSPGTYTVTLIVRNKDGSNAIRKDNFITVYPFPNVSFTSNLAVACAPAAVQFTDRSDPRQGTISAWNWNFGDGTPAANVPNPTHVYNQPGYYDVTLTVVNSGGCSNQAILVRFVRVVDGIQPNFTYNQVSPSCTPPFNVNFVNQTAGPGNLSYAWNFGSGSSPGGSNLASPSNITFPNTGNYTVNLQVVSSLGCSQTFQKTINFSQYIASFSGPAVACLNGPATFTNTSTPTSPGSVWDFGDGTTTSASPATKAFTALGTYNVKLVNHYATCIDSVIVPVTVANAPTPDFKASDTAACQPNLAVQFTDQSPGNPTNWLWDFGDGQTSTQQNPSHTYTTAGAFDVTLTVGGGAGSCSGMKKKAGYITIKAPSVAIDGANSLGACATNSPGGNPNAYSINPTLTTSSVTNITGYSWQATGASPSSSNSETPSFAYNSIGNYNINVTVTTADGCTAQATSTVVVGAPVTSPVPDFTIQDATTLNPVTSICGRDKIKLTANSTDPSYTYTWNYGDGTLSDPQNTNSTIYSYSKPFTSPSAKITLSISSHGCPAIASHNLVVNGPFPNFGWAVNCDPTGATAPIDFRDSSIKNNPTSYVWDFGDGQTESDPGPSAPSHLYTTLIPYTVSLKITDGTCTQSYNKQLLLAKVTPNFSGAPSSVCKNLAFTLTSTSTLNTSLITPEQYLRSYIWQLGPQAADTTNVPNIHTGLDTNGVYNITLTTVDVNGCKATSAPQQTTAIGPTAHFTSTGDCKSGTTTFTENSALDPANTSIQHWTWDFGAGPEEKTVNTATHSFPDTGYFRVKLSVQDNNTCSDTRTDSVYITTPIPNFGVPDSFYCPGVPLTFLDSSLGYHLTRSWNYGDGSPADNLGFHTFATPGQTYTVTLTVTDTNNCPGAAIRYVNIQKPVAAFDINDTTAICSPLQTQFTAHGSYYDSLYWNFGDGSTSTLPVTSHFYNSIDTFTATLYVQGPGGCRDSVSRRVLVLDPVALTKLRYGPLQRCDSVPVTFNIAVPGYTSFFLTYGDGSSDHSGDSTSFHVYRNPNNYRPILQMTDSTGCVVAYGGSGIITVLGATPFFTVSKHAFCDSNIVAFTDYTITNNGLSSETYSFADGSPDQSKAPGTGTFNVTNFFDKAGTWQVALKVTTDSGCTETYLDTIHVYQTPHPLISLGSLACAGIVQFDGSITAPQVDTINWSWNFAPNLNANTEDPTVHLDAGNYNVTLIASTNLGCADTTNSQIKINPVPEIKGPKQITTPLGFPVTIPFTYSSDVTNYTWSPAANLDCSDCANPVATLLLSTQYTVTVTDSNNCRATDSVFIKTVCTSDNIFMPNTFSPNGDGVNDVFYPRGKSLYNVQSLSVFNRWGQMVFQRKDFPANTQSMGWDGNFNGHPAPSDAYVYIVEVICENAQVVAIHGSVTLVR